MQSYIRFSYYLAVVLSLSLITFSLSCSSSGTEIEWHSYDPRLLEEAERENRPVILDFSADWCAPCQQLEAVTFSQEDVIRSTKPFVMVRVDLTDYESPRSQELRAQFGVTGVPEILFLDADGREVAGTRILGFVGPEEFLKRVRFVQRERVSVSN